MQLVEDAFFHPHRFARSLPGRRARARFQDREVVGDAGRLGREHDDAVADRLGSELVGRNVLFGRWTFQVVEEFDDTYWSVFREDESRVRDELQDGARHVFESEMKDRRRTDGLPGHERRP